MTKRTVALIGGAVGMFFVTFALLHGSEPNRYPPCYSIREAKFRGCFVRKVSFQPNVIAWDGKRIVVKEAWLERCLERGHTWFSVLHSKPASGYNFCVTLSE